MQSLRMNDSFVARSQQDLEIIASLRRAPTNQDLIDVGLDLNNPDVLVLWQELLNRPLRDEESINDSSSIDGEESTSSSILTTSPISSEQIEGLNLDFVLPFNLLLKVIIHLYKY